MTEPKIYIIDNLDAAAEIAKETVGQIVTILKGHDGLCESWEATSPESREAFTQAWHDLVRESARRNILSPEDLAMLQALYSRSPKSVIEHLAKVWAVGSGKFMDQFLVGYGHASIGDCGTTTVFIEGVPMLAAKAIQDWPLYSGQEASTRYMDFSTAPFENPTDSDEGHLIQERWRDFYLKAMPVVHRHIAEKYPRRSDEDPKVYERAVSARAFDVMRAFLPAGAHTYLSWTTNLRQANDKLRWLCEHPDAGIARVGKAIFDAAAKRYPHSFGQESLKTSRDSGSAAIVDAYVRSAMKHDYFLGPASVAPPAPRVTALVDEQLFQQAAELLESRPRGGELPPWLAEVGTVRSEFRLDFGSFRDLQRHRSGTIRMPMLTTKLGFHRWYLDELPEEVRDVAVGLIATQIAAIDKLRCEPVVAQNYVAMGFQVSCRVTQPFPAFVYRLELRSSKTVHPTLRAVVHDEIAWFRSRFPRVALHVDTDPDSWTVRRGKQTIEAR